MYMYIELMYVYIINLINTVIVHNYVQSGLFFIRAKFVAATHIITYILNYMHAN